MAITCPGCGREYDVTLFQFGRTLRCTCGARVGLEKRIDIEQTAPPRFVADVMLGHLARWLRIMGYDTAWPGDGEDEALVRRALEEERILLTRDRRLPAEWRISNVLLLDDEHPSEQIRAVVDHFALDWKRRLFTRCSRCNEPLERMDAEVVRARQEERVEQGPPGDTAPPNEAAGRGPDHGARAPVPDDVLARARSFRRCATCGRVYWEGSHTERIRARLEGLLEGGPATGAGRAPADGGSPPDS